MPIATENIAAASAAVGVNLAQGKWWQQSPRHRRVTHVALVGSVNPSDAAIEIMYGQTKVAEFRNTRGGANLNPNKDDLIAVLSDLVMLPNELLNVYVKVAPTTNPVVLQLIVQEF